MTALLRRLFGKVVTLREGEAITALLMFAYSFLAMTAYNIIQPITRSKFIGSLGVDNLPYVQLAAGLLIGVLIQLYSRAIRNVPRRWVIPVTQAGEVVLLGLFWLLFRTGAEWVSAAFYVLGLILGILLISQFWTLANDIYDARQAKRLFGFIGGGAGLGGAMGAAVTSFAVEEVGTDNLLLVSAAILTVCVILVAAVVWRERVNSDLAAGQEVGVGGGEAIRLLRTSRHLQVIALVITCAAIGAVIIDQQLNMAAATLKGEGSTDAITGFLAQVRLYLSLFAFVVQVGLTSRIHRSMGLLIALLILPASLGATAVVILFSGSLVAPAAARVLDSSLRYSIDKTTREVLFLPLPTDLKYRAKPFVDVTVDRFARGAGALMVLALIKPWGLGLDWQRLSYASLAVTSVWIVVALRARREYLKTFRRGIETRAIVPGNVRLDVSDAATIELLVEELSDAEEARVLYAIEMLETLNKRNLITPLLLHHESAKVRARALAALETARPSAAARWQPAVERMLKDGDADVRAAAVHALAVLSTEDASIVMRRYLDDPEPRVSATAAAVLANSALEADADTAEAAFRRLTEDTREVAAASRREAAAALARVTNPRFRPLLVPLIRDGDLGVARQAIRSVQAMRLFDPLFVPALVALLGHRILKPVGRDVLVSYGDDVLDALGYFLKDPEENIWVRRHIPATFARIPTQRSMDALLDALDDSDGFLRYKVVVAIEKLHREHPYLAFTRRSLEALVLKESSRYYDYLTLRYSLVRVDTLASRSLLVRALDDKLERTLDRIYLLLALIYPWRDVVTARYTIEHSGGRARSSAIEYLDNLLGGAVRKCVMPIIDDSSMEEKVRHAHAALGNRTRDLEGTLARLVRDDDQVVGAAAVHFVAQRQDAWRPSGTTPRDFWTNPLTAVDLAERIRGIPLFDFVSVDELFRFAAAGQQVRHEPERELYHEGVLPDDVHFLLDGSVQVSGRNVESYQLEAPAALAFEEILQGSPLGVTIRAVDRGICLVLGRGEVLTMLSDNIALAQGLFRMLLDTPRAQQWRTVCEPPKGEATIPRSTSLSALDKVLLLRQNALLARASVSELLHVAGITRVMPLSVGTVLFTPSDQPALYHLVEGEVRLDADGSDSILAGPGSAIGVAETLAGVPVGRRATVTRAGRALRLDHEELFDVLGDHIDLLQSLFSGLLTPSQSDAGREAGLAGDTSGIAV